MSIHPSNEPLFSQTVRVQPGNRVEVIAPQLHEGDLVLIQITTCNPSPGQPESSIVAFIDSLPEGPRQADTWEKIEASIQLERDSWEQDPS